MNLSKIDTGISDIYGEKIYTGDIVLPVKFNDVNNIVLYIYGNDILQEGFYRIKVHKSEVYYNKLGNCKLKKIGEADTESLENFIKFIKYDTTEGIQKK
jgi:hypothetical protein